jgi:hypothetical protein
VGIGASVGAVSASMGSPNSQGSTANMLGPLNAALASKTAYSHANPALHGWKDRVLRQCQSRARGRRSEACA